MTALSPLFLLAGLSVAVPVFLHLFQRHQTRRLSFPALRYLERTEKEHARRIRLRQLLLLLSRVVALLVVVGAGARLVFLGRGASHPPTAVVVVLDNSLSSGLVVGETRVLDQLKELALATVDAAGDEDRFWLIRAGAPWEPALPGSRDDARASITQTDASDAAGDLGAALSRAVGLLENAEQEHREIHLLSDLQASAFSLPGDAPGGELPVIVWTPRGDPGSNRALISLVVGGGLPPLEGQRTEITVGASGNLTDTMRLPVRAVVDDRIRGAATLPAGAEASIALPPAGSGWVRGYVDANPDALRADDRRFFAYRSRAAPTVALGSDAALFVSEALSVLSDAGRVTMAGPASAALVVAPEGAGLDQRGGSTAALVLPPADATLLPALNRRLVDAQIPYRYEARASVGAADLEGVGLPVPLEGVSATRWFRLVPTSDDPGPATGSRTLAEVAGDPWAVEGIDAEGRRFLLIASPMSVDASTLPVSAAMLRFVDWASSEWASAGSGAGESATGTHLSAPARATHVRFPSGDVREIDGTRMVRGTGEAGFYEFLDADTTVSVVALNPPSAESDLTRLDPSSFTEVIGRTVVTADAPAEWGRAVFRARQGPELWWPLLAVALLLLVAESLMATSGQRDRSAAPGLGAHATE